MNNSPGDRGSRGTILLIFVGTVLWLALWAQIVLWASSLQRTYDGFGLQLPILTKATLAIAGWTYEYSWIAFPSILAIAACYAGLFGYLRSRPAWAALASILAWVLALGLTAINLIVAGSLLLPLWKLQEGLAK